MTHSDWRNVGARAAREWEQVVCAVVVGLLLLTGFYGTRQLRELLQQDRGSRPPPPITSALFNDGAAWRFVTAPVAPELAADHAFLTKAPPDWVPKLKPPPPVVSHGGGDPLPQKPKSWTEIFRIMAKAPRVSSPPVVAPVVAPPVVPPVAPAVAHPNPPAVASPPKHFLCYHGFMQAPSGQLLAFVTHQSAGGPDGVFVEVGRQVGEYAVKSADKDVLVLQSRSGRVVSLRPGQKLELSQAPQRRLKQSL